MVFTKKGFRKRGSTKVLWIFISRNSLSKEANKKQLWKDLQHRQGLGQKAGMYNRAKGRTDRLYTDWRVIGNWWKQSGIREDKRGKGKPPKMRRVTFQNKTGNDKPKAELHICGVAATRATSCHQGVNWKDFFESAQWSQKQVGVLVEEEPGRKYILCNSGQLSKEKTSHFLADMWGNPWQNHYTGRFKKIILKKILK